MRRTGWCKTPDLSAQMDWQHADESAVLTWTVKAIDRSVAFWTVFFLPMLAMPLIALVVTLFYDVALLSWLAIFCFSIFFFLYIKVGLERTVFVYRATEERLEICQWQDIPDMLFTFLRVLPFLVFGIVTILFIIFPGTSIAALAGPALIAILMASFGSNSSYKKIFKDLEHYEYRWDETIEALLDTRHGLIRLRWPYELPPEIAAQVEDPEKYNIQGALLYFRRDQENQIINLVESKLPQSVILKDGLHKYTFSS